MSGDEESGGPAVMGLPIPREMHLVEVAEPEFDRGPWRFRRARERFGVGAISRHEGIDATTGLAEPSWSFCYGCRDAEEDVVDVLIGHLRDGAEAAYFIEWPEGEARFFRLGSDRPRLVQ